MKERRRTLLKFAKKINCDTIVTFEPENLFYLTGFWGEGIGILENNGKTTIIAPELEVDRAKSESKECQVIKSQRGAALLTTLTPLLKTKKICLDCQSYEIITSLKKFLPKIIPNSEPFHQARMIKDEKEIQILRQASKILDEMFDLCTQKIKKGLKEYELQAILMSYAMSRGMFATGYKYTLNPLIIASGPNGSLPHAQVSSRKFHVGDLIVVDLTLRYKGYVSDATRTFGLGRISEKEKQVYEIVKESQKLGLKTAKPYTACNIVDDACRKFIKKNGYDNYFIHSTGHGIGIDVHELPTISSKNKTKLTKNMAITIEPGIYVPKQFGIRIEDSIVVKEKPLVLHKFTKDLVII